MSRRWQNRQTQEWEEQTSFFNVVCWREMAENVAESLAKGSRVSRHRPPRAARWETENGDKRSVVEIVADEIGPSLRWATAEVTRNERRGGGDGWRRRWRRRRGGGGRRRRRHRRGCRWRRRPAATTPATGAVLRTAKTVNGAARAMARDRERRAKSAAADRRRPQKKKVSILNPEQHRLGRLQGRQPAPPVHVGAGQDPRPPRHRQLRAAAAGGRAGDPRRPRDGAAAVQRAPGDAAQPERAPRPRRPWRTRHAPMPTPDAPPPVVGASSRRAARAA